MKSSPVVSRARTRALVVLSVAALTMAAACVPPPAPEPDPVTPWLEPGCIDSTQPGVPDFTFSGLANVLNNAVAYLDEEGQYSEDGSCQGVTTESGTIVRANTQADAATVCANLGVPVAEPPRLVDHGYAAPIDAWTCVGEPPADFVEFSGPGTVEVTIQGDGDPTTVPFTGEGSGSWNRGNGDFALNLSIDDGFFNANTPLGPMDVYYTAVQDGTALGNFDPATGVGGFDMGVTMTLVGLNAPEGMPQPCDLVTSFQFEGAIDLDTGVATVSQDDFDITPPGADDCGGLGALIGPMLSEGERSATMTFQVFEP